MGISIAVTRVAANTSTGTQDITTTDLGGLTPKAVLLIATRGVTDGTAADGAGMYWGASDGTNEWAQVYESQHAQASMNIQLIQDTTANRILTIHNGAAASTVEATADFDSFISNGVRINWTDAPASAFLVTAVFFAGTDLSAHVGIQDLGNTADALIGITSVGFEADVLITTVLKSFGATSTGGPCFGFVHNNRAGGVTQRCVTVKQRDGFGTSQVAAIMRDGECIAQISSTDLLDYIGAAQSFDSSGFDIQLGGGRSPTNADIGWIALRFGSSPVVDAKVYTYSTPTATGANTDANPSFEPQFVMYAAGRAAAADTLETDADGGTFGAVVVDGDDLYTASIGDEDGAADSNTQSLSDDGLNLPTHTGASGHIATLTSMGSTGPVWSYSATDATARLWPALAIEIFSSGGITGTAGITESPDTLSASGAVAASGTSAITEAADTLSGSGSVSVAGTASIAESADTITASGVVSDPAITGTAGITEGADTITASGSVAVIGAASIVESADTITASGSTAVAGTASISESPDTVSGAGSVSIGGTASISENADTLSGSGAVAVSGTAGIAEAGDTLSASGTVSDEGQIDGAASITEGADVLSGAGSVSIGGTASISESGDALSAAGSVSIAGVLVAAESPDSLSGSGVVRVSGTAGITESGDTPGASGVVSVAGAAIILESAESVSTAGAVPVYGTASITEGADTLSAVGGEPVTYQPTAWIVYPERDAIQADLQKGVTVKREGVSTDRYRGDR